MLFAEREGCARAVFQHDKCKIPAGTAAQVAVPDAVLCALDPPAPSPAPTTPSPPAPSPPSPPSPMPTPSPAACTFIDGMGFSDYTERLGASSKEACCAMCRAREGCTEVVFQNGKCKFSSAMSAQTDVSDAVLCKLDSDKIATGQGRSKMFEAAIV